MESELSLFSQQIEGVYFWKLIRLPLFNYLVELHGHIETNNIEKNTRKRFVKTIVSVISNTFFYSTFRKKEKKNILIFENPRKFKGNDGYYDPYTYKLVEKLRHENKKIEIIDSGFEGAHLEAAGDGRSFSGSILYDLFYRVWLRAVPFKLKKQDRKLVSLIEKRLEEDFGKKIELKKLLIRHTRLYKYQYAKYSALFKYKAPEKIYIICSYGKEGLIQAARLSGAEIIEIQHGVMGKYHLGYDFPKEVLIPYFPDQLLLFGKYWKDSTSFPSNLKEIDIIGFYDFYRKLDKYKDIKRKDTQIVFVSQWTNGKKLSKKALEVAGSNPEYKIIFRLHPAEREAWKMMYPELKAPEVKNFKVDDSGSDIYHLLFESKYVVGVYSTVLYEAIGLGCNVIQLNLYGAEYMDYLVKKGYIIRKSMDEVLEFNNLEEVKKVDIGYFFGKNGSGLHLS